MTTEFSKLKIRSMDGILLPDIPPKCKWALDKSTCGPSPHAFNSPRFILNYKLYCTCNFVLVDSKVGHCIIISGGISE